MEKNKLKILHLIDVKNHGNKSNYLDSKFNVNNLFDRNLYSKYLNKLKPTFFILNIK